MIKALTIKNFESHKDTQINFGPNVNVIWGESEQGKSAIFRALIWVITNRPIGNDFCSHWGGETSVSIELENCTVTRIKSKGNKYILKYKNGKSSEFNAVAKQGVPPEISEALGIKPINIQTQFDNHFLLPPISPGEAARQINQFVDLEIIDKSIANSNADVRELKREVAALSTQAESQKEEIDKKYSTLDKEDALLNSIEVTQGRITALTEKTLIIEDLWMELKDIQEEMDIYVYVSEAKKDLQKIEDLVKKLNVACEEEKILKYFITQYTDIETQLSKIKKQGNRSKLENMQHIYSQIEKEAQKIEALKEHIESISNLEHEIADTKIKLKKTKTVFDKHMPETCFFCGQIIKKKVV